MGLSRKAPVGRGQCGSMALGRPGRREDLLTSAAAARAGSGGASGGRLGARRWGDRRRLAGWMAGWLMVLSDENEPCARGWRLIREEAARNGGCWSGRGRRGGAGRRGPKRDGGGGAERALEASLLWAGFGGGAGGGGDVGLPGTCGIARRSLISLPGPVGLHPGRVRIGCTRPLWLRCWCECKEACSGHDATARRAGAGLEGRRQRERVGDEDVAREWERAGDFRLAWRRAGGGQVVACWRGDRGKGLCPAGAPHLSPLVPHSLTTARTETQTRTQAKARTRAHAHAPGGRTRSDARTRTAPQGPSKPVWFIASDRRSKVQRQGNP